MLRSAWDAVGERSCPDIRDRASRKQANADTTRAIGFSPLSHTEISMKSHASNEGLRDGKVLTENIDGITFRNKEYNFRFILSDRKKLVDEAFKEFLALKKWEGTITANTKGGLHTDAKIVRGDHEALKYRGNAFEAAQDLVSKGNRFLLCIQIHWLATCSPSGNLFRRSKEASRYVETYN